LKQQLVFFDLFFFVLKIDIAIRATIHHVMQAGCRKNLATAESARCMTRCERLSQNARQTRGLLATTHQQLRTILDSARFVANTALVVLGDIQRTNRGQAFLVDHIYVAG
jgi:hypothetical protein